MNTKSINMMVLAFSINCFAHSIDTILDGNFNDFLKQVVAQDDRKDFDSSYYISHQHHKRMLHQQQKRNVMGKDSKKIGQRLTELQEKGRMSLEVRDPSLAAQLKTLLCSKHPDPVREKKVRALWYRYGLYEEFLQEKASRQKSILTKTKSYVRDAGNKMISWFGNFRKTSTTT